jgi:hypothetical protein
MEGFRMKRVYATKTTFYTDEKLIREVEAWRCLQKNGFGDTEIDRITAFGITDWFRQALHTENVLGLSVGEIKRKSDGADIAAVIIREFPVKSDSEKRSYKYSMRFDDELKNSYIEVPDEFVVKEGELIEQ